MIGLQIVGYNWKLPYIPGYTKGHAMTFQSAIEIAVTEGIPIQYNEVVGAAYFVYQMGMEEAHIVWFQDARSIVAFMEMMNAYHLRGAATWNIMHFDSQMWTIINTQYEITKLNI